MDDDRSSRMRVVIRTKVDMEPDIRGGLSIKTSVEFSLDREEYQIPPDEAVKLGNLLVKYGQIAMYEEALAGMLYGHDHDLDDIKHVLECTDTTRRGIEKALNAKNN